MSLLIDMGEIGASNCKKEVTGVCFTGVLHIVKPFSSAVDLPAASSKEKKKKDIREIKQRFGGSRIISINRFCLDSSFPLKIQMGLFD
jgi:hypothetical protein